MKVFSVLQKGQGTGEYGFISPAQETTPPCPFCTLKQEKIEMIGVRCPVCLAELEVLPKEKYPHKMDCPLCGKLVAAFTCSFCLSEFNLVETGISEVCEV